MAAIQASEGLFEDALDESNNAVTSSQPYKSNIKCNEWIAKKDAESFEITVIKFYIPVVSLSIATTTKIISFSKTQILDSKKY